MTKPLRRMATFTAALTALGLLATAAFLSFSPELGGTPTKADRQAYAASGHYNGRTFENLQPTEELTGSMAGILTKLLFGKSPQATPAAPLPVQRLDSLAITRKTPAMLRVTWFGHSASLVEIAGKNILLDPMLSLRLGPVPAVLPKRYVAAMPITVAQLPPIDAVLISHDHYDHLDYQTILKLKEKVSNFYVPLGIGPHLRAWGVAPARIHEMNWGDAVQLPGLTIRCTPSRHFSGRGITNRNSTMWASWVLQTPEHRVFFSGDGGYGRHFKAIGAAYGPFDLALMECGQYDDQWAEIHMKPEQSVQAALDVRAAAMLPVHWAAFTEANHAWTEPVERASAAAARLGLPLTTPRLGQPVTVGAGPLPQERWWVGL